MKIIYKTHAAARGEGAPAVHVNRTQFVMPPFM